MKVVYERQTGEDNPAKVKETYLVEAVSCSDAEQQVINEIKPFVFGESETPQIRQRQFFDFFLQDSAENFYEAKVEMITINGGKETRSCAEDRQTLDKKRIVAEYSLRFNVWQVARENNGTGHPAIFPLKLAEGHILSWSNEGDTVLDPFMGSGTSAVACIKTNRHYIGFERNKDYYDMSIKRVSAEKKQLRLF